MSAITQLRRESTEFIKNNLIGTGFKYSRPYFYCRIPMGRQILSLIYEKYKHGYDVVPALSIRHDELEKLYQSLLGQPLYRITATIGTGYGDPGTGEDARWSLYEPKDIARVGNAILAALPIMEHSFFDKFSSLEAIYSVLVSDNEGSRYSPIPYVQAEKALVAAFLLGRKEELDALIDQKIESLTESQDAQLGYFLDFAVRLRRYVKEKG